VVPFPLAWTWTIHLRRSSAMGYVQPEIDVLAEALRREGAKVVASHPAEIEFACPGIIGMNRWALLAPISGGSVVAVPNTDGVKLTYSLRFVLVFWASLVFALIFASLSYGAAPLKTGFFAFSWLYFGNIAISLYRFPAFIRRVLSESSPPNTSLERTRER
jgi:hypothetical protein